MLSLMRSKRPLEGQLWVGRGSGQRVLWCSRVQNSWRTHGSSSGAHRSAIQARVSSWRSRFSRGMAWKVGSTSRRMSSMSMVAVVKVDRCLHGDKMQIRCKRPPRFCLSARCGAHSSRREWGSVHRPRIGQPCGAETGTHTQHCSTCSTCCGRLLLLPSSRDPPYDSRFDFALLAQPTSESRIPEGSSRSADSHHSSALLGFGLSGPRCSLYGFSQHSQRSRPAPTACIGILGPSVRPLSMSRHWLVLATSGWCPLASSAAEESV